MNKICNEIRTCLSGASYVFEHGKLGEVEALYKSIYRVARRYGSPADARYAAKALVYFYVKTGRLSSKCRMAFKESVQAPSVCYSTTSIGKYSTC
jgi:hypothetical protein